MKDLYLDKGLGASILRGHPWIYSGAIKKYPEDMVDGEMVRVLNSQGNFMALGYYQEGQSIAIKVLSLKDENITNVFWLARLQNAWELRMKLGLYSEGNNVFRWVNGEGDYMPGLIIDYYNGGVVIQYHHPFYLSVEKQIVDSIKAIVGEELAFIFRKSQSTLWRKSRIIMEDEWLYKKHENLEENIAISERSIHYKIEPDNAQKTGFFIDQRDNRSLVRQLAENKKVLNTFSYTGGFSLSALAGGASKVVSVDSSERAMKELEQNLSLNDFPVDKHRSIVADVFDFFKEETEMYDIVILDPPAFAKNKSALQNASKSYKRLNIAGLKKLNAGGLLMTYSCSQVIDQKLFEGIITSSIIESGRTARLLYRLDSGADHPHLLIHPEGRYLKGLVIEVN